MVYARLLGKEMIILNTLQAARDLLEKRSAIYSDRPRSVLLEELYVFYCTVTTTAELQPEWGGRMLRRTCGMVPGFESIVALHNKLSIGAP